MKKRLRKKWHSFPCSHWDSCINVQQSHCLLCKHFSLSNTEKRNHYSFDKLVKKFASQNTDWNWEWEVIPLKN